MLTRGKYYRARVGAALEIQDAEGMIASGGGVILRIDRKEKETAIYFEAAEEEATKSRSLLAERGEVSFEAITEAELDEKP